MRWASDNNMSNWNKNAGYGRGLVDFTRSIVPTFGNIMVVMANANSDESNYHHVSEVMTPDPDGTVRFFNTIAAAYAACESNNNDVILLDANSSHSEAMVTVSKNRIHFIGMDGGGRLNSQGAKISTPATSVAGTIAAIKNTGTRNTYRNIKFIQNGTNAAQVTAFWDTGEGTYVKNCSFHHNSLLTTAARSSVKFAGDTCHYEDCQIGNSTVRSNVDNVAPLLIKNPARYSYFVRCMFISYSQKTTASCIDVPDADGVIGWIIFKDCFLLSASKGDGANAAGTMAEGVTSILTSGYLYFVNTTSAFATAMVEADASLYSDAIAPTASAGGGISVAGA